MLDEPHFRECRRKIPHDLRRTIAAAVVDDHDFEVVGHFAESLDHPGNRPRQARLLVVGWQRYRYPWQLTPD